VEHSRMKTIFIATDFSRASLNACFYGIELAKAYQAKVILYTAFQVPVLPPAAMDIVSAIEMEENLNRILQEEVHRLNPLGIASIETISQESPPTVGILEKASEKNADLIIIGMKAGGKRLRHLFGSTATAIARRTNIALLVIPETTKYAVPKIITLASDIIEEVRTNIHLLYFLRQIAEKFESKIYVVRVGKGELNKFHELTSPIHKLDVLLANLDVKYENAEDYNITHGLNEFIKDRKTDLLVMIPHKHDFLVRLFIKSETEEMLFHSTIPMLILPENPISTPDRRPVISDHEQY
jgi:nucleotide-binding universal stress UspA family protein